MNKQEINEFVKRYESRHKQYGISPLALGWKDIESQLLRFKLLLEVGVHDDNSVLDVGCGFGDFAHYMKKAGFENIIYVGWDIVPLFIEEAKKLHVSNENNRFELKNIFLVSLDKKRFDWIVASGVLNTRIDNNVKKMKRLIKIMFRLCNKGIAINMLTDYVDYKKNDLYYYSPEKMFSYSKKITKRVALRHDYPLYEFTLYLYK